MATDKADKPRRRSFLQVLFDRWWKKLIAGILIFAVAVLILTPYGIRYGSKRFILASGGDEASIEDVDFNPFTGRLALSGVVVEVDKERYLRIEDAEVLVRWLPLFKKRIVIKRVWVNDTEMTIESLPGGEYRLGGVTAALLKGSPEEQEEEEVSPWGYGAREVTIENTTVHLRMPDFKSTVHVNKWIIQTAFSWQPVETANVDIDCEINGSPLKISGQVTPFAKAPRVTAKLKLDQLKTDPFNGLLKDAGINIAGAVSLDTNLELNQKEDGSFTVAHDGSILLEDLGLKSSGLAASATDIEYDGKLNAALPSSGDLPLKVNTDGQLTATGLDAKVGEDEFKEEKLGWKGIIEATVQPSAKKIEAVMDGSLDIEKFTATLSKADLNVAQSGFNWKGKVQALQASDDTGISLDGSLTIKDVQAQSETLNVLQEALNWEGRLDVNLPKGATGLTMKSNGRLEGGRLDFNLLGEKLSSRHDAMAWEGDLNYAASDEGARVDLNGSFNLDGLAFDSPDAVVAGKRIDWTGEGLVDLPHENKKPALQLDGKVMLGPLNASLPANHLEINQESFSYEGPLAYGKEGQRGEQASGGAVRVSNLRVTDDKNRYLFMGAEGISVDGLRLIGENAVGGDKLQIDSLQLLGSQQAKGEQLLGAKSITLQSFEVNPENKIEIDAIVVDSLQSMLKRKSDGQWAFSERLAALQPPAGDGSEQPKADKAGAKTDSPQIRIGKLVIQGDSQIGFEDTTVKPAVDTTLALDTFEMGNLNSSRPAEETPLKLAGKIGKYSEIDFEGTVKPFDERLSMDMKGAVTDLELPPYSPYIAKAIGYKFASGQMDADLKMAITRGEMDGLTKFEFHELRAKAVEGGNQQGKQPIPVETAMSLLREKDGTIRLDVPITGDIEDPQFSFADAINQAVVKATATASLTYLKFALGPYGLALAAAEVAYKAASKAGGIRLEPVKFTAGTTDIDPSDQGYIEKLAAILKDRPDAKIRVCGLAAQLADQSVILAQAPAANSGPASDASPSVEEKPPSDEAEEETLGSTSTAAGSTVAQLPPEQLEELAESRSMAVKDLLVSQYGIKDDRILLCHPEIDKTAEATPRAEILF